MSLPLVDVALLSGGAVVLFIGVVLSIIGARAANAGRALQKDAEARLAATNELAADVKRLIEKVEQSMDQRDAAIEKAFAGGRANPAPATRMSEEAEAALPADEHNDNGRRPRADLGHLFDREEQGIEASADDYHDDGEHDDHCKTHDAESGKRSLFSRLFRRAA
ncbi:MAG: hypothetical protein R3C60_05490 [Parvularculaceae bacterium]